MFFTSYPLKPGVSVAMRLLHLVFVQVIDRLDGLQVQLEDLLSVLQVGLLDRDVPVESPGS